MRRTTRCVALACLFAVSAGFHVPLPAAEEPPPAPVIVETVSERLLAPVTWFPGTVISRHDARLAAEVDGRLDWVAEVGTIVKQGEPVARIDDTFMRQALSEGQATVQREESRLAFYEQEVKRLQQLAGQNNAAQSQLDEAVSNRGVTRGELAAARVRAETTREKLARTVIRAPFEGVVTERLAQAGEWAEAGEAVTRLVDTRSLEVQARVPAYTLNFIASGSELVLASNPRTGKGTVRAIVPVGDDRSRLYELRLALSGTSWPAGQTLRVGVPTAAPRNVVAVDRDALVLRRNSTVVYRVLADNTAERVEVESGIASGPFIEIRGAIQPGDRVVTRGGERLRPGQKVAIVPGGKAH